MRWGHAGPGQPKASILACLGLGTCDLETRGSRHWGGVKLWGWELGWGQVRLADLP